MGKLVHKGDAYELSSSNGAKEMVLIPQKDGTTQITFPGTTQTTEPLPKGAILTVPAGATISSITVQSEAGDTTRPRVRLHKANIQPSGNFALASGSTRSFDAPMTPWNLVQLQIKDNQAQIGAGVLTTEHGNPVLTLLNPKNVGKRDASYKPTGPSSFEIEPQTAIDPETGTTVGMNLQAANDKLFSDTHKKDLHVRGGKGEAVEDLTKRLNTAGPNVLATSKGRNMNERHRYGVPDGESAAPGIQFKPFDPRSIPSADKAEAPEAGNSEEKPRPKTGMPRFGTPGVGDNRGTGVQNNRGTGIPQSGFGGPGVGNSGPEGSRGPFSGTGAPNSFGGTGAPKNNNKTGVPSFSGRGGNNSEGNMRPGADERRPGVVTHPKEQVDVIELKVKLLGAVIDPIQKDMIKFTGKPDTGTLPSTWYEAEVKAIAARAKDAKKDPYKKEPVVTISFPHAPTKGMDISQSEMTDLAQLLRMDMMTDQDLKQKRKTEYEAKAQKTIPSTEDRKLLASPSWASGLIARDAEGKYTSRGSLKANMAEFMRDVLSTAEESNQPIAEVYAQKKRELIDSVKEKMRLDLPAKERPFDIPAAEKIDFERFDGKTGAALISTPKTASVDDPTEEELDPTSRHFNPMRAALVNASRNEAAGLPTSGNMSENPVKGTLVTGVTPVIPEESIPALAAATEKLKQPGAGGAATSIPKLVAVNRGKGNDSVGV